MDHSVNGAKLQGFNYSLSRELDYKTFRTLRTKTQMAINTVHLLRPTEKKTDAQRCIAINPAITVTLLPG
jgi:hypothetical protein